MIYVPSRRKAFQAGGAWMPPTTDLYDDWDAAYGVYEDTGGTDAAEDTDPVAVWTGNYAGIDISQTTLGNRPFWTASDANYNSLPSIGFDGSGDWMDVPDAALNFTGTTTFLVFKSDTTSGARLLLSSGGSNRWYGPQLNTTFQFNIGDGTNIRTATADTNVHIAVMWKSSTQKAVYYDGSQIGTTVADTTSSTTGTLVSLGTFNEGGGFLWQGSLSRMIIYHAALGSGDISDITSELQSLYGL